MVLLQRQYIQVITRFKKKKSIKILALTDGFKNALTNFYNAACFLRSFNFIFLS